MYKIVIHFNIHLGLNFIENNLIHIMTEDDFVPIKAKCIISNGWRQTYRYS